MKNEVKIKKKKRFLFQYFSRISDFQCVFMLNAFSFENYGAYLSE